MILAGLDVRLAWRLAALGLGTVIVQVAAVSQLKIFGTNADLTPLVVASCGLLAGSLPGAVFGFAVGMFLDLALVQTMGLSSLLFLIVGYGAGRLRELRDPQSAVIPIAVGAAATAIAQVGFSVMQFLLGAAVPVGFGLLRQILLAILLGALIAPAVHVVARRWLGPALPEDPRRRRRSYTTGGLSPLSRSGG